MGEAARRREVLGLTRTVLITRRDLFYFLDVLLSPRPDGTPYRPGDRTKRRSFISAMRQLGLMDVWQELQLLPPQKAIALEDLKDIPEQQLRELTVDQLHTVQQLLPEWIPVRAAMNLAEFEEMIEGAIAGTYQAPELPPPKDGAAEDSESDQAAADVAPSDA